MVRNLIQIFRTAGDGEAICAAHQLMGALEEDSISNNGPVPLESLRERLTAFHDLQMFNDGIKLCTRFLQLPQLPSDAGPGANFPDSLARVLIFFASFAEGHSLHD